MAEIRFTIDDKPCTATAGQTIWEAARDNGVYIPALCQYNGLKPAGACRICTVRVNGRFMAACTQPIGRDMVIENTAPDLEDMRRALVEMLFVEGNHLCPTCEKSGHCELQALAYRYGILAPRFPYMWPLREIEAAGPHLLLDHNRCIQCLRCVRAVKTEDEKNVFAMLHRSEKVRIGLDPELGNRLTEETAQKAMDICPVGAIIKKEVGFAVPIGKRKFDAAPIGSETGKTS